MMTIGSYGSSGENEVGVWKINNTPIQDDNANVAPTPTPAQLKTIKDDWI